MCPLAPYADRVSDGERVYTLPVRRRPGPMLGAVAFALGCVVAIGFVDHGGFSGAFVTAGLITLTVLGFGVAVAFVLLMPTRIEVGETRVRLVAPRATTTYVPAEMLLLRRAPGVYEFRRISTGRVLAVLVPRDPDTTEQVFGGAGVRVEDGTV